jgi:hypothetical protein
MRHTRYDIFNRWMPLQALQTEEDQFHFGNSAMSVFTLPAPYFLQFGQTFMLELRTNLPNFTTFRTVDVCLRGWDPDNDVPLVMGKQAELPAVAGNPVTVTFDENRDSAIRSGWIKDVVFSFTDADGTLADYIQDLPFYFEVRFRPTTGPEWADNQWTRLIGLTQYAGVILNGAAADFYRPIIIHRPIEPHILRPEEELRIELLNQWALGQSEDGYTYYCWVIGEQEPNYVG